MGYEENHKSVARNEISEFNTELEFLTKLMYKATRLKFLRLFGE